MAQELPFYLINAFTDGTLFLGNPAAVFIIEKELESAKMQAIASDLNLPATVFYFPSNNHLIRWFAPYSEIPLCGHGTLALGHVLFNEFGYSSKAIELTTHFDDKLSLQHNNGFIQVELPRLYCTLAELKNKAEIEQAFGITIKQYYTGDREVLIVDDVESIVQLKPNFTALNSYFPKGIGITAWRGNDRVDIVSRVFHEGVPDNEDPVTGSMHSAFTDVWHQVTEKTAFAALQASKRGGMLYTQLHEKTVNISAKAKTSARGLYLLD